MSRKLQTCGTWESSNQVKSECKERRPSLNVEERAMISGAIAESFWGRSRFTFVVFEKIAAHQINGVVSKIDRGTRRIKLETSLNYEWIRMDDIVAVIKG
jgi:hypothetical protein